MSFTLRSPEPNDIPTMSQVAHQAFSDDPHTILKAKYAGFNHGETMAGVMKYWLEKQSDRYRMMKAVDRDTGEVIGYVTFGRWGYNPETEGASPYAGAVNPADAPPRSEQGVEGMEEVLETHIKYWMDKYMSNQKCIYINSLNVPPAHRAKGVGTALVRWAVDQADQDAVPCTVFSSDAALPLYVKAGFEEMGKLDLDLAQFAQEEQDKQNAGVVGMDHEFGVQHFKYLRRMPYAVTC